MSKNYGEPLLISDRAVQYTICNIMSVLKSELFYSHLGSLHTNVSDSNRGRCYKNKDDRKS